MNSAVSQMAFQLKLGQVVPDFEINTTQGKMRLHDFIKKDTDTKPYTILVSHPADYTPVCTTELGKVESLTDRFTKRGVKLLGISTDSLDDHKTWSKDIMHREKKQGEKLSFPIIADESREITNAMGLLDPSTSDAPCDMMSGRAMIVFDKSCRVRVGFLYPVTTGRNFNEVLRVIDSLRMADEHKVVTPVDWKPGDKVLIPPSVSNEDAKKLFGDIETEPLPSGRDYMRFARVRGE